MQRFCTGWLESATVGSPEVVGPPVEKDDRMARLEAVLFVAKEPLHPRKLSKIADLADGTEALTLVSRLNDLYDQSARAFRVEEVAGGWQLRTRPQFGSWLRRLTHVPRAVRLSPPSMETLAVVAYRQPVVRADIEEVRGVACGELLRQLMERDLVRVIGRSEELGRPYLYGTTKRFLQIFGLTTLDELPRADEFRSLLESEAQVGPKNEQTRAEGDDEVTVATVFDPAVQADDGPQVAGVSVASGSGSNPACLPVNPRAEDEDWDDDDYEDGDDDDDEEFDDDDDEYEYVDDDDEPSEDDEDWDDEDDEELEDDEEWVDDDEELDDDEEWVEVDDDDYEDVEEADDEEEDDFVGDDEEWDDDDDDWEEDDDDWEEEAEEDED